MSVQSKCPSLRDTHDKCISPGSEKPQGLEKGDPNFTIQRNYRKYRRIFCHFFANENLIENNSIQYLYPIQQSDHKPGKYIYTYINDIFFQSRTDEYIQVIMAPPPWQKRKKNFKTRDIFFIYFFFGGGGRVFSSSKTDLSPSAYSRSRMSLVGSSCSPFRTTTLSYRAPRFCRTNSDSYQRSRNIYKS